MIENAHVTPLPEPIAGDDAPAPGAVAAAFGLPGPVLATRAVGGAWLNRAYCLETPAGRFAVKQMDNPWGDPHWQDRLLEAWEFEQRGLAAGVSAPEPVPNPANGGCLAHGASMGRWHPVRSRAGDRRYRHLGRAIARRTAWIEDRAR